MSYTVIAIGAMILLLLLVGYYYQKSQRKAWRCSKAVNGQYAVLSRGDDGYVRCMTDKPGGTNCVWVANSSECDKQLKTLPTTGGVLSCGSDAYKQTYGKLDTSTKDHWCWNDRTDV